MSGSATHRAIESVWRIEAPRIIAAIIRTTRNVSLAEEATQEALVEALQQWPTGGIPDNPGAWLLTTARRRAIDAVRRDRTGRRVLEDIARSKAPDAEDALRHLDGYIEDDVLRLIFMSCHPSLPADARAALTLRLVCGLTTAEVARAYLTQETTIAQRIVRAKRTLTESNAPFEVPSGPELPPRLASVLEVIYLVFNEGYAATGGNDWTRPALCEEATRLARMLTALLPAEPDTHALSALLELQASRLPARTDVTGAPILLLDQDRNKWDQLLIRRGLASLEVAQRLASEPGTYTLQTQIAACHARARTPADTDWREIVRTYAQLHAISPSPVIALNMAVAVGMTDGPAAGLALADKLQAAPSLANYHLLPSVRAEFLRQLGRTTEACTEFERAASLASNLRDREILTQRAANCAASQRPKP
ncbi:MAG TPA: RNA polymerase sigma factor [Phycisphaerales bacterium]|nr:RNA polymerase sigma factor [Phycisphaerales bacterium]